MTEKAKVVVILVLLLGTAFATIWYIHPDSTLNSIQAGLDSCSTDDTVLVGPGVYYENIIWPNVHGIDLFSEFGPDSTIIDGDSAGSVVVLANGADTSTRIAFVTIRNGFAFVGGGILCLNHSAPTIFGNIITNNATSSTVYDGGAGICCDDSSAPFINGNIIQGNMSCSGGGGIMCNHYSSPIIMANTITTNVAGYGGGIFCHNYSSPTVIGNIICHNQFPSPENANILADSSRVTAANIDFRRTPMQGGGICLWQGCTSLVDGNSIFGNSTMSEGGGISCYFSSPTICNNTISNNTADYYGGGIACGIDTCVVISHNTIITNHARHGGGISVVGSLGPPYISNNTISANDSDGIFCDCGNPIISNNNITYNVRYGVHNVWYEITVNAENNWWGDSTGPYHPSLNPGGLGDSVSDYIDFDPWLSWPVGVEERPIVKPVEKHEILSATIISGPLRLREGKECKVFDITGRVVEPEGMAPGIYFVKIDNEVVQKVVKIR